MGPISLVRPGAQQQTRMADKRKGVESGPAPSPKKLKLPQRLRSTIRDQLHLEKPTQIQEKALEPILQGQDVLGSGKTLAYLLPVLTKLALRHEKVNRSEGTLALIMTPTRELCIQIELVLSKVLRAFHWMVGGSLMGGESKKKEKDRLRKGVTLLVCTPGRLLDHLQNTKSFRVDGLSHFILDETDTLKADRLLDLGFGETIQKILGLLDAKRPAGSHRQNLLISATLSQNVKQLAAISLRSPTYVDANAANDTIPETKEEKSKQKSKPQEEQETGEKSKKKKKHDEKEGGGKAEGEGEGEEEEEEEEEEYKIPDTLEQHFVLVDCKRRLTALTAFLRYKMLDEESEETKKIVVFFSTTESVEFHHLLLNELLAGSGEDRLVPGDVFKLHGNMAQQERSKIFFQFRDCAQGILLCTDVAARGLDLPNIYWIIQYDPPGAVPDYVHRIGRAARIGRSGKSLLFLMLEERAYVKLLKSRGAKLTEVVAAAWLDMLPKHQVDTDNGEVETQLKMERYVLSDPARQKQAIRAYLAFVRAYSTHTKETKKIFHPKKLHLGHVAKSFALRETPSQMKNLTGGLIKQKKAEVKKQEKRNTDYNQRTELAVQKIAVRKVVDEFAAF